VILSEDTRHSGKLLQYYNIKAQLVSYLYMESSSSSLFGFYHVMVLNL